PSATYGVQVSGMARLGGNLYMAVPGINKVFQIDAFGFPSNLGATVPNANGLAANPLTGHLFVSSAFNSAIYDVNPITGAVTLFAAVAADGLAFDPATNTLYAAGYGGALDQHVVGLSGVTGAVVFDSGVIAGNPDGIALGTGALAGNLFVNTNAGTLVEVNLA